MPGGGLGAFLLLRIPPFDEANDVEDKLDTDVKFVKLVAEDLVKGEDP